MDDPGKQSLGNRHKKTQLRRRVNVLPIGQAAACIPGFVAVGRVSERLVSLSRYRMLRDFVEFRLVRWHVVDLVVDRHSTPSPLSALTQIAFNLPLIIFICITMLNSSIRVIR